MHIKEKERKRKPLTIYSLKPPMLSAAEKRYAKLSPTKA